MREAVHVIGGLLILSGLTGTLFMLVQAYHSLEKAVGWQQAQPELISVASERVDRRTAHERLPFVILP